MTERCCRKRNVFPTPPGLKVNRKFDVFSETWGRWGLEVVIPEKAIAGVGKAGRLKSAGRGKVTIDSGAAESVMPRGMLEGEPLVEGEAKRLGQKRIRFKKEGLSGVSDMLFKVTDVGEPLASVTWILDKGNTVVFSRKPGGSYIMNNHSGQKIQLTEEKGTFVMDVEYLEPDLDSEGFARQGN